MVAQSRTNLADALIHALIKFDSCLIPPKFLANFFAGDQLKRP